MKFENENPDSSLAEALAPLAAYLLANAVTGAETQLAIGQAFVTAAQSAAKLKNGKVNQSKVAIMTGYSRTEIRKFLSGSRAKASQERVFGAKRLMDGWSRDPEFSSRTGARKKLPVEGDYGSFHRLAKKFSGDIPPKASLDELLRVGLVKVQGRYVAPMSANEPVDSDRARAMERLADRLEKLPQQNAIEQKAAVRLLASDALDFFFDSVPAVSIAEDRVRQSSRAFMNGLAASIASLAAKGGGEGSVNGAKLTIEVRVTKSKRK